MRVDHAMVDIAFPAKLDRRPTCCEKIWLLHVSYSPKASVCPFHSVFKRLPNQRVAGRSQDSGIIVPHDLHWYVSKQALHAAFVQEGLHKDWMFHARHDFCGNTAADEDAA